MPEKAFSPDGICRIRFKLPSDEAYVGASVVGEFNEWQPGATPFVGQEDGSFAAEVDLEPGRSYRFRYLLDDGRWENDWAADAYVDNEFGGADSVVTVPVAGEVLQGEAPAETGDDQAFGMAIEREGGTMTDSTTGGRVDAVELLTSQHREVEQLWSQLNERGASGPDQPGELVRRIVQLLSQHDAVETRLLYPAVREVEGGDALADHSLDEHQEVRECLKDVERGHANDPATLSRLGECIEAVQRHVQEEEGVIFPKLRAALSQEQLYDLGGDMAYATEKAPTHPHPTTPNHPVGAAVAGAVTGAIDRARDKLKGDR